MMEAMDKEQRRVLAVVSGFSGVGKGTLLERVLLRRQDLEVIRSCTTRQRRDDRDNYTFLTREQFEFLQHDGLFLESNCYCNEYYGTPVAEVERILGEGKCPVAEIDPNGLLQVLSGGYFEPDQVHSVFIAEEAEVLVKRLLGRKTDPLDKVIRRLGEAIEESRWVHLYDHVILNRDLEASVEDLDRFLTDFVPHPAPFDGEAFRAALQPIREDLIRQLENT